MMVNIDMKGVKDNKKDNSVKGVKDNSEKDDIKDNSEKDNSEKGELDNENDDIKDNSEKDELDNDLWDLPDSNNTSYPLSIKEHIKKLNYNSEKEKLKYHQFVVKQYFTHNPNQRGLLISHSMGTGKTRIAVAIAEAYRKMDSSRNIICIMPKSLEGNFRNNLLSVTTEENINDYYKFISLNASNMFKQVEKIKRSKYYTSILSNVKNALDHSLLIMDEAHNFFNSITNGSKNAVQLYDLIINSTDLKIIFLTGTPIINDPFELVPCFNMLKGYIDLETGHTGGKEEDEKSKGEEEDEKSKEDKGEEDKEEDKEEYKEDNTLPNKHNKKFNKTKFNKKKKGHALATLFTESREEFEDYFIDEKNKDIKNKDKFTNRIWGMTSYYGDLYEKKGATKEGFPKKSPIVIERIPMSEEQFARYSLAREMELEESQKKFKGIAPRFSAGSKGSSTYRVKTRQISNYCIPEYALGPINGKKTRLKFIDKIKKNDLLDLDNFSPKMKRILSNINKHDKQLGIIYSQFVSGEGLSIFAKVLEINGYHDYSKRKHIADDEETFGIKTQKRKYYLLLSGEISPEERTEYVNVFNKKENTNGDIIALLLLSGALSEGIDLKRVRHVHIMEPFWNYARISQVETRAVRYLSHQDLPPEDQNVQTYIYLSMYPSHHPRSKITEPTTDDDLYTKSINNMVTIDKFMLALAETSIDCAIHNSNLDINTKANIHCKICAPTNEQMYYPLLSKDMTLPSLCTDYKEKTVKANEIIHEPTGEKFYYSINKDSKNILPSDVNLFAYDSQLKGYIEMKRGHPLYSVILEKILDSYENQK